MRKTIPFFCNFVSGYTGIVPPCSSIVVWDDSAASITDGQYLEWNFMDTDVDSLLEMNFMVSTSTEQNIFF